MWQPYSTRAMGRAILNRLVPAANGAAPTFEKNTDDSSDAEAETAQADMAAEGPPVPVSAAGGMQSRDAASSESKTQPAAPIIGMDGKTSDGAMPYELLKKQLDLLR